MNSSWCINRCPAAPGKRYCVIERGNKQRISQLPCGACDAFRGEQIPERRGCDRHETSNGHTAASVHTCESGSQASRPLRELMIGDIAASARPCLDCFFLQTPPPLPFRPPAGPGRNCNYIRDRRGAIFLQPIVTGYLDFPAKSFRFSSLLFLFLPFPFFHVVGKHQCDYWQHRRKNDHHQQNVVEILLQAMTRAQGINRGKA